MSEISFKIVCNIDLTYGENFFEFLYDEIRTASLNNFDPPSGLKNPSLSEEPVSLYRNYIELLLTTLTGM